MADLLSSADRNEIRSAIGDVTDTFGQKPITYKRKGISLDRMNKDRDNQKTTDYIINGLVVWENTDNKARTMETRQGGYDYSMGYVLLNVKDVPAALMTGSNFNGTPEADDIAFDGITYKVRGINMLGQFPDQYTLVKIHFRKNLKAAT